ncbi:MAG: hypothetical protein MnENMB40S_13240 [Rhizobiaceae bacterium MnEN-MB40S]|nr:MAG: hypothetical protein MnENMB40S_13240 [Rhizobiaceae bacterium MnEN-MB40S]
MPGAITAIATIAASVATTTAAANAIFWGVTIAAYTGISVGISYVSSILTRPQEPRPEDVQQSTRQNTAARVRHYGRVKTSGPWLFAATKRGGFHKIIALSHGEIDGIEQFWIDDNQVTLDGSEFVQSDPYFTSYGGSRCSIITRLGASSDEPFTPPFDAFTEDHRGEGIAMLYSVQLPVGEEDYAEIFPNGINTLFRVVLRGAKIKNPTTGATAWDDNGASVIRDYLISADGMRLPESALTTSLAQLGWEEAFARCAEAVSLKAGGTEERYRLWGSYSLQERPADVIGRMLACTDGRIVPTADGGVTLKIGTWTEPDVTLDEDSIIDVIELTRGLDIEQRPNTIRATFLDPDADYATGDADPWEDEDDIVARGIEVDDVTYPMSPSHGQCRRLMKKRWYRRNPEWAGRFAANMRGLALIGEDLVRIRLEAFGIDHVFEIQDLEFNFGEGGILLGVVLDVISLPEESEAWAPATEEGDKPETTDIDEDTTVPEPTGFVVTIKRISANLPYALIGFDAPPAESVSVEAQFKRTAASQWIPISVSSGATEAESPNLSDETEYEFQIRHITARNRPSDWTDSITITPTTDEAAPDPVSSVSATPGVGEIALQWTTPDNDNFSRTVIRRNTTNDEGGSEEVTASPVYGPVSTVMDLVEGELDAGTYYYWIYAANAAGVESTAVATGSVVVD